MSTASMEKSAAKVVSPSEWLVARKRLLAKEKEFTRLRDELSRERREMPMEKIEKNYVFQTVNGNETLSDLFQGRSQLIVYHFMFGPGWQEGCPSCSFLADSFDAVRVHLAQRDATLVVVSRATLPEIEAFKKRMGWQFKWVSSAGTDFNDYFHVSFSKEEMESGKAYYNYTNGGFPSEEGPGASIFCRCDEQVFHSYSAYARGLDILLPTYNWLDLTPKGRDEEGLPWPMAWVRHHDRYSNPETMDAIKVLAHPLKNCCSE
jgi:predicted dithiol-disulfide oxidoreductase (DUF899 family)